MAACTSSGAGCRVSSAEPATPASPIARKKPPSSAPTGSPAHHSRVRRFAMA